MYCNRGEYVIYRSDEHGFRNPPGLHEPGGLQVALVGDSFAKGYCVDEGETLADGLRERFPRTLSLGVDDSGPLLELAALRECAAPLRPPVVLWLYFEGNDPEDVAREWQNRLLTRYLEPGFSQELRARQPEIDALLERFVRARARAPEHERSAGGVPSARNRAGRPGASGGALLRIAKLTEIRRRRASCIRLRTVSRGGIRSSRPPRGISHSSQPNSRYRLVLAMAVSQPVSLNARLVVNRSSLQRSGRPQWGNPWRS